MFGNNPIAVSAKLGVRSYIACSRIADTCRIWLSCHCMPATCCQMFENGDWIIFKPGWLGYIRCQWKRSLRMVEEFLLPCCASVAHAEILNSMTSDSLLGRKWRFFLVRQFNSVQRLLRVPIQNESDMIYLRYSGLIASQVHRADYY